MLTHKKTKPLFHPPVGKNGNLRGPSPTLGYRSTEISVARRQCVKYKLSIKKLSVVEEELKLILVGKLTMLLRLKDCRILLS